MAGETICCNSRWHKILCGIVAFWIETMEKNPFVQKLTLLENRIFFLFMLCDLKLSALIEIPQKMCLMNCAAHRFYTWNNNWGKFHGFSREKNYGLNKCTIHRQSTEGFSVMEHIACINMAREHFYLHTIASINCLAPSSSSSASLLNSIVRSLYDASL